VDFEDAAAASGLRKPTGRTGAIRVVTIHELDRSACGGTHVRATGEIGAILIRKVERVKHQVRLEFLCGERAVRRARSEGDLLAELAATRSAAAEDLPALLAAERAEIKAAAAARRDMEEALAGYRARELYASATADPRGRRLAIVKEPAGPVERLRATAQAYASLPAAVFVGVVEQPPALLFAAAADTGLDAGKVLKAAVDAHGGRGGGNARMAQGTVKEGTLDAVVETILRD
jgi:alanyl-tRNA synthetase